MSDATNMLVDGEWRTNVTGSTNDEGGFDRQETIFHDWIKGSADPATGEQQGETRFPVEPDRYHLYICRACPWAHRTVMTRALKELEDAISLSLVQPERYDEGWEFSEEFSDPLYDFDYLREVYTKADPTYTGRVTVPVLWDKQEETIVNNESEEIMRMLDTAFDDLAKRDVNLYPEGYQKEVDEIIANIYEPINNGVYRTGFAGTQEAYDEAISELFNALNHWEEVLDEQRYLAGDVLTEADICMFSTLVRFDHVYHVHFKCNQRAIHEYHNLWNYAKELHQLPGMGKTVNMDHIVRHYYRSHGDVNPKRLVPIGPDIDFTEEHDRDRLPGGLPEGLVEETTAAD